MCWYSGETGILDLTTFPVKKLNFIRTKKGPRAIHPLLRGIIKGEMLRFKRCMNDILKP